MIAPTVEQIKQRLKYLGGSCLYVDGALKIWMNHYLNDVSVLLERNEKLEADIRCMVEKAADNSLEGYRELGRQLAEKDVQIDRLRGLVYSQGTWACKKCHLIMQSSNLYVQSGTVGANNKPHSCPNCNVPMWKITYKDMFSDTLKMLEAAQEEINALKGAEQTK